MLGTDRVKRMLQRLPAECDRHFEQSNRDNAEDLVGVARVLIPNVSGVSRAAINNFDAPEGGQIVDFGVKAKVIEGNRGPRPFVNPALAATKKPRKARNRKALKDAIRSAKNG